MNKHRVGLMTLIAVLLSAIPAAASEYRDGKKAYERGDFDQAVVLLVRQLREKPKHRDSAELLAIVLPFAYKKHQAALEDARARQNWDAQVVALRMLTQLSAEVDALPPIVDKKKGPITFPKLSVATDLEDAMDGAAEFHYQRGLGLLEAGGGKDASDAFARTLEYLPNYKDARNLAAEARYRKGVELKTAGNFKEAAIEFRSSRQFVPDYKDAAELYQESRDSATMRIAVMPFENKSGKPQFGAVADLLSEQVLAKALRSNPEFIQFVNRDQLDALMAEKGQRDFGVIDTGTAAAAGKLLGVHAFVFGKVLLITEEFPPDHISPPQSNSVQVKNYDTGQYQAITALFRQHTREGSVTVQVAWSLVDGTSGKVLDTDQPSEKIADEARWVTFQGDERAVPDWARQNETPGGERRLQSAQTMVNQAIDALSSSLALRMGRRFE